MTAFCKYFLLWKLGFVETDSDHSAEARGALANYQATTAARKGQFQGVLEQLLRLRQT